MMKSAWAAPAVTSTSLVVTAPAAPLLAAAMSSTSAGLPTCSP